MTAVIDGVAWVATCVATASRTGSTFTVGGSDAALSLTITATTSGPGNFSTVTGAMTATITAVPSSGGTWTASASGGTGALALTRLDAQGATGTFNFSAVAVPNTAAVGTRNVVSGALTVAFQ